jgi:putative chitinase
VGILIDKERFFAARRNTFGPLSAEVAEASGCLVNLEFQVDAMRDEPLVDDVRWFAYMLATQQIETCRPVRLPGGKKAWIPTFGPGSEVGSDDYFLKMYDPRSGILRRRAMARKNGNTFPGSGKMYRGRGRVMLTWLNNYRHLSNRLNEVYGMNVDLVANPELANDQLISYRIMVLGMVEGAFTSRRLSDYINGPKCDYINARRIINGTDRDDEIANLARRWEGVIRASL